jgi:hypothetical protein
MVFVALDEAVVIMVAYFDESLILSAFTIPYMKICVITLSTKDY